MARQCLAIPTPIKMKVKRLMPRLILFVLLFAMVGCAESKPLPADEPNLPTVGTPPPPPGSMMGKKGGDYAKGINRKQ